MWCGLLLGGLVGPYPRGLFPAQAVQRAHIARPAAASRQPRLRGLEALHRAQHLGLPRLATGASLGSFDGNPVAAAAPRRAPLGRGARDAADLPRATARTSWSSARWAARRRTPRGSTTCAPRPTPRSRSAASAAPSGPASPMRRSARGCGRGWSQRYPAFDDLPGTHRARDPGRDPLAAGVRFSPAGRSARRMAPDPRPVLESPANARRLAQQHLPRRSRSRWGS